jgi:PAS domain S-box-containing protein
MVIVSQDGRIQLVNGQLEKLFGYARSELIGQSVDLLIAARYRQEHSAHRMEYFSDSHARPMGAGVELHGVRRDGTEFPAEISLASVETSAGKLVTAAIRDVTDRKRAEELGSRLAAVVDSSDDAIIGKTLAGVITSWNKGAERIFGYTEAEALGRPIAMLIPEGRKDEEPAIFRRLLGGERIAPFETLLRRNDGQVVHTSVAISAVRDSRGKVIGVSTMVRDVSDRKRGEQALARATESAETASREFEAFRYSVAHDLRAPLRGIDGFSHALLDEYPDKLDSEGRRYLAKVRESAQYMAQLIESLLALARISQSELKRERVDLSAIAHKATRRLQTEHPGRRVDVHITDGLNCQGDDRLLGIAFANLFGNAWKFTAKRPDPRVEFGVTRIRERDAFFVSDNGAGFDMAFAEKLFGVFQRLHTGTEFAGTGIGLATVQRVIRRHGGRIWAEAAVEHGATFYFTLAERGLTP